jgi:TatA/E family protein of Tat protein translocase
MGPLGWQETIFIFVLALLIFGPKKLPELGKTIGKAMTEFRRASSELKSTWDREMHSLERETDSLRDVTQSYNTEINNSYYDYDYSHYDSDASSSGSGSSSSASTEPSTVSASAPQGAETNAADAQSAAVPSSAGGPETAVAATVEPSPAPPVNGEDRSGQPPESEPVRS